MPFEFCRNRSLAALMRKGETELAARVLFERNEVNSSGGKSHALCICSRPKRNIPGHGAKPEFLPRDGAGGQP